MSTSEPLKYRAFLSYSHRDSAAAKRLHASLEGFRVDKDLVGRDTATGKVPRQLRPIFRDRHDFDAGGALGEQTVDALDGAAAMILLASPASAASKPVNEEVRLFRERHPDRPLIPVILDGTPNATVSGEPERECFPPALRELDGVLAADIRESGDGMALALAKIIARLLGLPPDEVFRRAERERRRRTRIRHAVTAALIVLAVGATGAAFYARHQQQVAETERQKAETLAAQQAALLDATLKAATDIVDTAVAQAEKYNVPRTATLVMLEKAEKLFDGMAQYGSPNPELRYRKAWMLIQFARNYAVVGDTRKERERALEAQQLFAGLAQEKPNDRNYQYSLAAADMEIGIVLEAHGSLTEALNSYRDGLTICERLATVDPGNAKLQRGLLFSYSKIGDVLVAQGSLAEALQSFRDSLAITERLAKAGPGNAGRQRDLSVAYSRIGDVLVAQGSLAEALQSFRDSLAITERLAEGDPSNAGWQHDLSTSYDRVGEVLLALGTLDEALQSYRRALALLERLTKADSGNAQWQSDLSVTYVGLGDVQAQQGNPADALQSYRHSVAIVERLAKADPSNALWQNELSLAYDRIGDALAEQGDLAEALKFYRDRLVILERLANADPDSVKRQRSLVGCYVGISWKLILNRQPQDALDAAQKALILDRWNLTAETNHAHALLLLGRFEEATKIYLKNKDKPLHGKTFADVIREDFVEMRKHGIDTPDMKRIEELLAS